MTARAATFALLLVPGLLMACARADLSPQASAFATALGQTTAPLLPKVAARAAAEDAAARETAIRSGGEVYELTDACTFIAIDVPGVDLSDCRLIPLTEAPAVAGSGKLAQAQLTALQAYADSLVAISASKAPAEIGQSVLELAGAFEALGGANKAFGRIALSAAKLKAPAGQLATLLAEARKAAILRRLILRGDGPVREIIRSLIADLARTDRIPASSAALTAAYKEMEIARDSGNPGRYAAALATLETANAQFKTLVAASDAGHLMLLRNAQMRLAAAVSRPTTPEEFLDLAEAMKKLADAL